MIDLNELSDNELDALILVALLDTGDHDALALLVDLRIARDEARRIAAEAADAAFWANVAANVAARAA